ncbi:MFS general substrate transporter [Martensiomyces pterosporus]|nr:MFS general substrate transporter [Martensiomyces pterosporus]
MAIISLDLLVFLSALDTTIVATVYVPIGNKFNALDKAEWIITSYLITMAAFQPIYGKASDVLGRIEVIVFAIIIFFIGSILCAVSNSMNMLIASRAIQGIGGAGLMSMALVIVADIMNERDRGKYFGLFSGTFGIASSVAPVIGGAIVRNTKWEIVFWINIPLCVVAAVLIVMLLRIPRPRGSFLDKVKRIDFIGSLLALTGIVLILMALSWGGREYSWSSSQVVCCLVFGAVAVAIFAVYEWKVPSMPIIPMHLFRTRNVVLAALGNMFFGFAINGPAMFIPQWALVVKQANEVTAGAYLVPFMLGMVIASIVGGGLMSKTGKVRGVIWVGSALLTLGNGLLIMLGTDGGLGKIIGFLLIGGLGFGSCVQAMTLIAQSAVSGRDVAATTTLVFFFRSLGMILAVSVLSNVVQNVLITQIAKVVATFPDSAVIILKSLKDQALLNTDLVSSQVRSAVIDAYWKAMHDAFIALTGFTAALFVLSLGFQHKELQTTLKKTIDE